jgi:hypothetical protein
VAEQLLNGAYIGAGFKQMGGEAMSQRMRSGWLGYAGALGSSFDSAFTGTLASPSRTNHN